MNTKIFLIVIALFGTSLVFSQNVNAQNKTNCEKKVVKKIKRNMNLLDVTEYVAENHKIHVILTYTINADQVVEVAKIEGYDPILNDAVRENLEKFPVKCDAESVGNQFTLLLTFKHLPG